MPLHRDFMMRMIQRLADAFFRIVAGKQIESPEEAQMEIEDLVGEVLGTNPAFVLGQGPAAIDTVEPALAAEVGRLLLLHATLSDEMGDPDRARRARLMGFQGLCRALEQPAPAFAELAADQLREHLTALSTVVDRSALSVACLGAHGVAVHRESWDDAEDWLFWALDAEAFEEALRTGRRFYERLLEMDDAELEAGGLTRDEVNESLREVEAFSAG